jgi:hypothetical protein
MDNPNYDPKKAQSKGLAEGANAGLASAIVVLLGAAFTAARSRGWLPWDSIEDPAIIGAMLVLGTAILAGVSKWWRNRQKHKTLPVLFFVLAFALFAPAGLSQDALSINDSTDGTITTVTYEWTSNTGGLAAGQTLDVVPGVIHGVAVTPGTGADQPSNNYDIVIYQAFESLSGTVNQIVDDLVDGELQNMTNAAGSYWFPSWPDHVRPLGGMVYILVTNAGNQKRGRIDVAIARDLRLTRGDASIPYTSGLAGQIAQYASPGSAKWVTVSNQATIADGGAVTLQGSPTFTSLTLNGALNWSNTGTLNTGFGNDITLNGRLLMPGLAGDTYARLRLGQDNAKGGLLEVFGPATSAPQRAELRLHNAGDADATIDYYRIMAKGQLEILGYQGGNVTEWNFQEDGDFFAATGDLVSAADVIANDDIYLGNNIYAGIDDTADGGLYLYGAGTGVTTGGHLRLYNSADHDGVINYWVILANSATFDFTNHIGGLALRFGTLFETYMPGVYTHTTANAANVYVAANGQLLRNSSSRRYKKDIVPLEFDVAGLMDLRPVSFTMNDTRSFGLIAEDVHEVFPQMVTLDAEGRPDGVNYGHLSVLLLEKLQEMEGRLRALEAL